ncbi:hypothetical protein [Deinococcus aerophilus]|uniref:hypothetical protein n=1 Tax=Deinococcus aerophilus TaxID=522488 RepID=UPI0016632919|nr:hypothetical protein [Deinococcus aerophilus]
MNVNLHLGQNRVSELRLEAQHAHQVHQARLQREGRPGLRGGVNTLLARLHLV